MTLRSDYGAALSAAFIAAKDAGISLITTNLAAISSDMQTAAAKGLKDFIITLTTSFQPDDLKLEQDLWEAYVSGILFQLASEELFGNEVSISLNTSDNQQLKVDLNFTF
jgi:hypothetical protein